MDFDDLAPQYNSILDNALKLSGESWSYFADYKVKYLARFIGSEFSGKILDYGCGIGNNTVALKTLFSKANIHGFDPSLESLNKIPQTLLTQGRFVSDEQTLDNNFDLIFLANVVHHMDNLERREKISFIKELLNPGGRLIIYEHNPWNPLTQWSIRHSPIDIHAHLLRKGEIIRYLKSTGFRILHSDFIIFFPGFLSRFRFLEPFFGWCPLGAQYAVLAQKMG